MPAPSTERSQGFPRATHSLVLTASWVLVTATLVTVIARGAREAGAFEAWATLLQTGYVAALLWHLGRTGPSLGRLPAAGPSWAWRSRVGRVVCAAPLAVVLAMLVVSDDGVDVALLFMMVATLWVLVAWHRVIRLRAVGVGLVLSGTACLAGTAFRGRELISDAVLLLLPAFVLPMFVAGGLLIDRTGLGRSQLHRGRYAASAAGFLRGAALFVPLGLVNAVDDALATSLDWVAEGWMPLLLPLFSGISEEAWFRLLLVPLGYFLLRPVFDESPRAAVVCALLLSAIVFGLGHGRSPDRLLITGLLYGLPMAVVFARRDWEHAVGAHYMINMVPWLMAYLDSRPG